MGRGIVVAVTAAAVGVGLYLYPPECVREALELYPSLSIAAYCGVSACLACVLRSSSKPKRVDPTGKAVVITGCDSGFGQKLALRLDALGFTVFAGCLFVDRDGATELKRKGSSRLHVVELNVTDDWQVQKAHNFVTEHLGENDLWAVVNNAGVGLVCEIEWCSVDQFQRIMDVNVLGVVRVTKAFLPQLRYSKGRVINVASLAGRLTLPMYAAYSMSKKAVVAFSDALRQEMAKFDMSVISVEPGLYKTNIAVADPYIDSNKRSWSETPTDVKEDYGEEYFHAALTKIRDSFDRARDQVDEVIEQMELAVVSETPRHRYVPYWMSYIRSEILAHLPSSWTDKIFSATAPRVKPQLIKRQESQREFKRQESLREFRRQFSFKSQ